MPAQGSVTLSSVRAQAQQRADMVNSSFLSNAEWNTNISNSYKELYDLLIAAYGNDYYVNVPVKFTTDGSTFLYPLPDGTTTFTNGITNATGYVAPAFYKLLGVDLALVNNQSQSYVTIRPFNFADRNRYAVPNFQSFYGVTNLRYRIQGSSLWLTPIPAAGQTIQIWYVPEPTSLANDSDTFDGISGWEEYVIVDAAIKALVKEESDVTALMAQKQAMHQRLVDMAVNRDAANPATVADVQWSDFWRPTGGSGGWGGAF